MQDTLTIPICQTSTYTFKDTAELIAFQVLVVSDLNGNCSALDFSFLMDLMLWRAPIRFSLTYSCSLFCNYLIVKSLRVLS